MARLDEATIAARLAALPDWSRNEARIERVITFATFPDAVAFIVRLGFAAEAVDHHPDLHVHYRRVTVVYWTHSEGGLTERDFTAAAEADRIAKELGSTC